MGYLLKKIDTGCFYLFVEHLAVIVKFNQEMYAINESDGLVKPVLILSDPLPTNLFLQVMTVDSSATSKWQIAT